MIKNHLDADQIININNVSIKITNLIIQRSKIMPPDIRDLNCEPVTSISKILFYKIRNLILNRKSIKLILPSFPYKSPNPNRVLGHLPDLAEEISIKSLAQLCSSINSITPFGCELIIASDGRVYGDLQENWWPHFNDQTINSYRRALEGMIAKYTSHIKIFSLDELGIVNGKDVPSYLENYSPHVKEISESISNDLCLNRVYTNMKYFRQEELKSSPMVKYLTKNAIKRAAAEFTLNQIRRGHAWSNIIKKHYPNSIRLSVHNHFNTRKLGIRLTDNLHSYSHSFDPSPWHSCALLSKDGKTIQFIKYNDGLKMGAKLLYKEDQKYALEVN